MTGQCPDCGEQKPLTSKGLVKAHSLPAGPLCLGTRQAPGAPRPSWRPCHTPKKAKFATAEAAALRALGRPAIVGLVLSPYECRCGWFHLTSWPADREPVVLR